MPAGLRIYNLFPLLCGSIAQWRAELPRIAAMGFNAVYVNPFHKVGFSGSLYAVKDHFSLDPRFRGGEDGSDDVLIGGFAAACAERGLLAMMDLVINHTAKDNPLVARHPEWYARDAQGEVRSPSAIDPADASKVTVWGDLAEIAFRGDAAEAAIIDYLTAVLGHYVGLGFRGFRCDAAYKVPARVWRALIGAARAQQPDCIFCAENLGARIAEVRQLDGAGFDYLFNSAKWWDFESPWLLEQYEAFRHIAPSIAFPESHDTPRLAAELAASGVEDPSELARHYCLGYAFAAAFSTGVMMPMGYEFGWARALDVVATRPEPREEKRFDLSAAIAAINAMKRDMPALNDEGPQHRLALTGRRLTALARRTEDGGDWAFTLINRDRNEQAVDADGLLAAAGDEALALAEATPESAGNGAIGARLQLAPLSLRVLRGRSAAARSVAAPVAAPQAGPHPEWSPGARIVIEEIYPEIDCGRYPVKRVVGDSLEVWADIFRDGHDVIAAALLYRIEGETAWQAAPMRHFDNDRWVGRAPLRENARYRYTIEAWTDVFASWRTDTMKKRHAGQSVALEIEEGRLLVAAAADRARDGDEALLWNILAQLEAADEAARLDLLFSRLLAGIMALWGERKDVTRYRRELEAVVDRPLARFAAWYEMFPRSQGRVPGRSASFADCIARLPEIRDMGFDVVYLPPVHPIGRVNRKGRNNALTAAAADPGSPYAIGAAEGGHRAVHPDLGGIEGFRRFAAAARRHGLELALDFAVQAAPDHPWVSEHPEWFLFRPDGTIRFAENPPKKYQDIVNPDFYNPEREALWQELRNILLFWIAEGVRIFRVDNPHTKPVPFWEWLIREVQHRHPDVIFLAEAFTRPKMLRVLAKAGFTQSYSYFTWRNTKAELTEYLTELTESASKEYLRPNFFTNTPDILPHFLQTGGRPAFLIRLVLAATLAGVYGIYNGFELCEATAIPGTEEYLHSEKYEYKVWDWDRPGNIKDEITRLNRFRRENPALHHLTNLRFYQAEDDQVLFYGKMTADRRNQVFVAVNLDPFRARETLIHLPLREMGLGTDETFAAVEAFTGAEHRWHGSTQRLRLDPAVNPAVLYRIAR